MLTLLVSRLLATFTSEKVASYTSLFAIKVFHLPDTQRETADHVN